MFWVNSKCCGHHHHLVADMVDDIHNVCSFTAKVRVPNVQFQDFIYADKQEILDECT